ncbi:MAG: Lipoprotein-releasing system permease protein [Chlorobi bacterium OLB5]|nr:MAG: Lipoprotein-releasing system permease protein [Chlorobi bacterium OLB5]
MFERFIARRYLLSKRKVQFITVITLISIAGLSVGVSALIVMLSVFNGFNKFQVDTLTGFDPHIRIEAASGMLVDDYNSVISKVKSQLTVTEIAPFTINKGVISSKKNNIVAFVKGVDDKKITGLSDVKDKTTLGDFEFNDNDEYGGVVLGNSLAAKLEARVLDTVTVMSPVGMEKALTQIVTPKTQRFVVRGIFDANNRDYDKLYSFISLPKSQSLYDLKNSVNGVELRISNIDNSGEEKEKLSALLGANYRVSTWYDLHEDLYSVMQVERWTAFIILSLIIAVASFSIVGSLTMTVMEKKRDIGILKAMGTKNSGILKIFMFEGILIGIYGTIIGSVIGLAVCLGQIKFKFYPLDGMVYSIDALPVDIRYTDFIYVGICAMIISLLASLYPALRAARQEPIKAIRWE